MAKLVETELVQAELIETELVVPELIVPVIQTEWTQPKMVQVLVTRVAMRVDPFDLADVSGQNRHHFVAFQTDVNKVSACVADDTSDHISVLLLFYFFVAASVLASATPIALPAATLTACCFFRCLHVRFFCLGSFCHFRAEFDFHLATDSAHQLEVQAVVQTRQTQTETRITELWSELCRQEAVVSDKCSLIAERVHLIQWCLFAGAIVIPTLTPMTVALVLALIPLVLALHTLILLTNSLILHLTIHLVLYLALRLVLRLTVLLCVELIPPMLLVVILTPFYEIV